MYYEYTSSGCWRETNPRGERWKVGSLSSGRGGRAVARFLPSSAAWRKYRSFSNQSFARKIVKISLLLEEVKVCGIGNFGSPGLNARVSFSVRLFPSSVCPSDCPFECTGFILIVADLFFKILNAVIATIAKCLGNDNISCYYHKTTMVLRNSEITFFFYRWPLKVYGNGILYQLYQ